MYTMGLYITSGAQHSTFDPRFTAISRTTRISRYQNVSILDFIGAKDDGGDGDNYTRRAKLQSNRHHQQTNTQFFTGRMTFLSPNQRCLSIEENSSHFTDLLTLPRVHLRSPNPVFDH